MPRNESMSFLRTSDLIEMIRALPPSLKFDEADNFFKQICSEHLGFLWLPIRHTEGDPRKELAEKIDIDQTEVALRLEGFLVECGLDMLEQTEQCADKIVSFEKPPTRLFLPNPSSFIRGGRQERFFDVCYGNFLNIINLGISEQTNVSIASPREIIGDPGYTHWFFLLFSQPHPNEDILVEFLKCPDNYSNVQTHEDVWFELFKMLPREQIAQAISRTRQELLTPQHLAKLQDKFSSLDQAREYQETLVLQAVDSLPFLNQAKGVLEFLHRLGQTIRRQRGKQNDQSQRLTLSEQMLIEAQAKRRAEQTYGRVEQERFHPDFSNFKQRLSLMAELEKQQQQVHLKIALGQASELGHDLVSEALSFFVQSVPGNYLVLPADSECTQSLVSPDSRETLVSLLSQCQIVDIVDQEIILANQQGIRYRIFPQLRSLIKSLNRMYRQDYFLEIDTDRSHHFMLSMQEGKQAISTFDETGVEYYLVNCLDGSCSLSAGEHNFIDILPRFTTDIKSYPWYIPFLEALDLNKGITRSKELSRLQILTTARILQLTFDGIELLDKFQSNRDHQPLQKLDVLLQRIAQFLEDPILWLRPDLITTKLTQENFHQMISAANYYSRLYHGPIEYFGRRVWSLCVGPDDPEPDGRSSLGEAEIGELLISPHDYQLEARNLSKKEQQKMLSTPAFYVEAQGKVILPDFMAYNVMLLKPAQLTQANLYPVAYAAINGSKPDYIVESLRPMRLPRTQEVLVPYLLPTQFKSFFRHTQVCQASFESKKIDDETEIEKIAVDPTWISVDSSGQLRLRLSWELQGKEVERFTVGYTLTENELAQTSTIEFNARKSLYHLGNLITKFRSAGLGLLAQKLEEAQYKNHLLLDEVNLAVKQSGAYPFYNQATHAYLDPRNPWTSLGEFVDEQSGLLSFSCATSANLLAYILSYLFCDEPTIEIALVDGFYTYGNISRSYSENVLTEADRHRVVRIRQGSKAVYFSPVPPLRGNNQQDYERQYQEHLKVAINDVQEQIKVQQREEPAEDQVSERLPDIEVNSDRKKKRQGMLAQVIGEFEQQFNQLFKSGGLNPRLIDQSMRKPNGQKNAGLLGLYSQLVNQIASDDPDRITTAQTMENLLSREPDPRTPGLENFLLYPEIEGAFRLLLLNLRRKGLV